MNCILLINLHDWCNILLNCFKNISTELPGYNGYVLHKTELFGNYEELLNNFCKIIQNSNIRYYHDIETFYIVHRSIILQ